ncbi:MAG: hypothetical protein SGI77_16080 [Pirellulaceae bacterium]|nr:hypothetical protein [Pirellulaceae bacterium]
MKKILTRHLACGASALLIALSSSETCRAGNVADWWLNNHRAPNYSNAGIASVPGTLASGYGSNPYNAYTGYPNTSYSPILPAGLPQTNYGLLPTGGYASQYYRAPTTYYRPVTAYDPNTGTTVTSLQPCASYQYQAQRVPLVVPSWSNYAYGGYGASSLQNRWSPITAPSIGSAAGQSSLSIASGFGTYGTSPVVQVPSTGAPLQTVPSIPTQPITSGYGGIYYGQPLASSNTIGTGNAVVPAAAWATPTAPQTSLPINGSAYSNSNSGYFGSVPQSFTQPATNAPPLPTTSGYAPNTYSPNSYAPSGTSTTVNGVTITPIGPPVTSPYPTAPIGNPTNGVNTWTPSSSALPNQYRMPSSTLGPMPGSMGQAIMPSAVSPTIQFPGSSVYPPVLPSTPDASNWVPSSGSSNLQDSESTVAPSLRPSVANRPDLDASSDRPRFQLRSVERDPSSGTPMAENPVSPWSNQESIKQESIKQNSGSSSTNSTEAAQDLELKLNMDSLRPIPSPQNFDASPEWKPTLLNTRDQTAGSGVHIRAIDGRPSSTSAYQEVRYLNGVSGR